jgi:CHAT domain
VARLLDSLRANGAHQQAAALLARDPAAHTSLDDRGGVARLLDSLRANGAHEQAAALADRAAAHEESYHSVYGSAPWPEALSSGTDYADEYGGRTRKRAEEDTRKLAEEEAERWAKQRTESARPARPRYLVGHCPESIAVGKPFSLLVGINVAASPTSAELELFDVPSEGQDVVLVMYAPGLHVLGEHQQTVHVPSDGDSRPARFELRADAPGPAKMSITAWIGGTHLGELRVEITAERDRAPGPHREVLAEITTQPTAGAVSLVVRYDPSQQAYRFEFRDEDNPNEVPSNLAYDPGPVVEQLIADLDSLAAGRSGYSADQTRDYLVNAGAGLWQQLVPGQLREQFWDRQHRIRQLTILADKDAVPWELLYPMDPGHDAGFLVEQFPVTRAIFGWRPGRILRLRPARFVLPEGSLPEAAVEVEAMRRLLDPGQAASAVISELTPLTDLIGRGKFGLLHFACHNTYEPVGGSCIRLGRVRFTPTLLELAAIQKALQASAPTVFINACRSAGLAATYNRLDGWASRFLEAGAAAFIGSLWAVSDGASREFAEELYRRLQRGLTLGDAVMAARQAAASQPDDPTWLAYTVYGDPRATISGVAKMTPTGGSSEGH